MHLGLCWQKIATKVDLLQIEDLSQYLAAVKVSRLLLLTIDIWHLIRGTKHNSKLTKVGSVARIAAQANIPFVLNLRDEARWRLIVFKYFG